MPDNYKKIEAPTASGGFFGTGVGTNDILQGAQGPKGTDGTNGTNGTNGTDGTGWTSGSYNASNGVVTFVSDDGLGFVTGDLRGAAGVGNLLAANNLSDLANAATARTNLGLGTAATTAATAYATAAQGTTADAALPKAGGTMTGNITMPALGTVDGRDLSVDGDKLDLIEAGATADQTGAQIKTAYEAETNAFTDAQFNKLAGIEASADVTDATNVTAAGALMDSEVTNLAQVKAFDTTDYATAAQGTAANAALPKSGGAMTGAITTNSTFDGRDVSVDGAKLDGIAAGATNTIGNATHTGEVTGSGALTITDNVVDEANLKVSNTPTNGYFLSAQSGNTGGLTWATVPAGYTNADVDTHLNTSTATTGEVLSWTGTDYDWIAAGGGSPDLYRDNAVSATTPVAAGNNGIAIGSNASNTTTHGSSNALAIGTNAVADYWATALGAGTDATGNSSLAVGYNSQATGTKSTAIMNSYASGTGAFAAAIDNNTSSYGAHGTKAIAIGHQAKVNAGTTTGIAIGDTAWCYGTQSIAIGYGAVASAKWAVSLNRVSEASAQGSAALGYNAKASGLYSTALAYARSSGDYSFAAGIGDNSTTYGSKHVYGVALGYQAVTTADKQIALGSSTAQVKVSGTYTLPTADGTANQVLTTDGSGAVTFATAGGGADLYAANEVSVTAQPSATGDDAIAIGDSAVASGVNAVASGAFSIASGTSSFAAGGGTASGFASLAIGGISGGGKAVASSDTAIALGYQASASNYQAVAIGRESNSSGDSSLALGRTTSAVGDYSTSIGKSYAGGSYSFAAAINNQSSSYGALGTSSVVIGSQNKAASGSTGALVLGRSSLASVEDCYAIGYGCTASGYYSMALGRQAVAQTNGKMAFSSGKFATDGDAQTGKFVLRSDTTDATPEALTTNNGTANTTSQVVLPNNSVYGFTGTIIARENSAQTNDFAVWEVKGGAVRAASASTTALGSYNINKISESTGAANWSIAISADTTNGAIAFTVTGEASHSIRWVATINTTEVTY